LKMFELLATVAGKGRRVYGIGAPARSTTLIHYFGLDVGVLDCVLEVGGSKKIGHYIPGTRIPVYAESKLFEDQPEFALLLSWHIADELVGILRNKGYKGAFIVPLPEPRIIR
jgi:C-methyltransferase C-terminal domain